MQRAQQLVTARAGSNIQEVYTSHRDAGGALSTGQTRPGRPASPMVSEKANRSGPLFKQHVYARTQLADTV